MGIYKYLASLKRTQSQLKTCLLLWSKQTRIEPLMLQWPMILVPAPMPFVKFWFERPMTKWVES